MSKPSRRLVRAASLAAAVAALVSLSACSTGPASTPSGADSGSSTSKLADTVAQLEKPRDAYPVPDTPIPAVSALKGKTVYFIPWTQQAPQFSVTGTALKQALATVGITVQTCDGGATPSQVAACVDHARLAKAGAIVTDSIPYVIAANAFDEAQKASIPILISDQITDSAHPASDTLAYIPTPGSKMMQAVADWIIVDSNGTANVLINASTDSPSTEAYVEAAKKEFSAQCPKCVVKLNSVSSANFSLIASSTSSALLKAPNTGYVISEFDQFLQPTVGGVQQTGRTASIKGASTAAQIAGLQMLAAKNFLSVDAGQASAYQGWVDADAALRLMTKTKLPSYEIPIRLFTRDNVADVKTDAAAEASGEWFGPTSFRDDFAKLWNAQ
ncbi:sugar ABC transporter substrate-binding protein [Gryllotalpicola ginsengisoli]|uniref:sugar ABC transporter substrate-binding protein n=1 Tax=Gryllotalpicola ginsengisoli TaxID=444608 RepID=UPI0003F907BE|nr:sugar ABC transporter substrate-binding protein [Gryllotalpicola ginsengisoli]